MCTQTHPRTTARFARGPCHHVHGTGGDSAGRRLLGELVPRARLGSDRVKTPHLGLLAGAGGDGVWNLLEFRP